jgi:hypothetical protein
MLIMKYGLLYTYAFIALLFCSVTGFAQGGGFLSGTKNSARESDKTFYSGDESNIWSSGSITATHIIYAGAHVEYNAPQSITFTAGFRAENGSSVIATLKKPGVSLKNATQEPVVPEASPTSDDFVSVYPNPSHGWVNIETLGSDFPVHVYLYDYTGRIVLKRAIAQSLGQFDLTSCPKGVYIIRVEMAGKVYTNKITLQ